MSDASERFTLDTNLLVYSVDRASASKHRLALEIVDRAPDVDCWLTLQAVSEFYSAVTRKAIMPPSRAAALGGSWLTLFQCAVVSASAVRTALADAVVGRASYWDALLVATAAEAGCKLILTEDIADGSTFGGVAIHNPFAAGGGLTERARGLLDL
jgi:predicted nucleic acid-binding protein